jgi:hypothetical protein
VLALMRAFLTERPISLPAYSLMSVPPGYEGPP